MKRVYKRVAEKCPANQVKTAFCSHCHKPVRALPMTPRMLQTLLKLMAEKNTKEIAFDLNVGIKTIETYRQRLHEVSGTNNLVGLMKWALRIGFTFPGEDKMAPDPESPFWAPKPGDED
jgi:DNA-binding CsgD family transcriptional regulator